MKQYTLVKTELFGMEMKKIHYDFKIEATSKPTKFIKIVVHHVGKSKTIQQIINKHVKKQNYSSIGYHFMIGRNGQVYYARDLKYAGAHTYLYNKNSIGIALFGDFDEVEPSEKQIETLKNLIGVLEENYKIRRVLGHNQAIYKMIKEKFWKLKLPDVNPIEIGTRLSYDAFRQEVTTKVLESDASEISLNLIRRLKPCPGFNMYKYMREIEK